MTAELRFITVAAVDGDVVYYDFLLLIEWMAPFNLAYWRCNLSTGVIVLCDILVLWFWVSVAPNFNNCLGAREEGLILLGNDDSIRMGCALRWKRDVQPWLVGNE